MKIKKVINLKKDLHNYIFSLNNELLDWGLHPIDIKVLSGLYDMDFEMFASGNVKVYDDRMSILFSSENKKKLMEQLNLAYNTFNNSLTKLRKKGLISKENTIDEKRLFNLNKLEFSFTINFIDEEEHRRLISPAQ